MNENILSTDCLHLRPIHKDDAQAILDYRADAETNKYQDFIPTTIDEVYEIIADCSEEFDEEGTSFQLVIIHAESDTIIGDIALQFLDEYQVEINCTIASLWQQKGFATEALITLIDFLFQEGEKHRIIVSIDPNNEAATKLLARIGFRKEAHFIESFYHNGSWVDDVQYGLLNREWDN